MKKATVFFTLALAALILFVSCGEDPFFHDVTVTDRDKVTTEIVFNGNEYTLPANSDAEFLGWKVNDEKYIKAAGEKVTINGETSIKAIYTDTEDDTICLLMYVLSDSNYTGSFTDSTKKTVLVPGDKETLPKGSEMKSNGGNFDGWYTAEDADGNRKYYEGGSEITVTSFTKLYANWTDPKLKYETVSETDSSYKVSSNDDTATSYKISEWYKGKKVTVIAAYGFQNNTTFTEITIPKTIETIGEEAFGKNWLSPNAATALTTVTFAKDSALKTIDKYAFQKCTGLTSCNLPSGLETIEERAFCECDLTGKIVIPASVASLKDYALASNSNLTEVEFEEGSQITAISDGAFKYCSISSIVLPETVTSIGDLSFYETELTSIVIPSAVTSIGYMTFAYCPLTEVEIGSSISTISEYAFCQCKSLVSIEINKSADDISNMGGFNYKWSYNSSSYNTNITVYDASGAEVK